MRAAVCIALALVACKGGRRAPDARPPEPAATATVAIKLDGADVATVRADDLRARTPLASYLPERSRSGWTAVRARAGQRGFYLDPFADYADLDVVLERDGSDVRIALYRPVPANASAEVAAELAKPRLAMRGIETIDIRTTADVEPATGPAFAPVTIHQGDTTRTFGPADTRDLALVVPPGRRGHRRGGWSLRSVVGDAASVTVTGATTRTLTAELTDPDTTLILRANRRGQLGLRVYRGGAEVEHVRAITRIDVSR